VLVSFLDDLDARNPTAPGGLFLDAEGHWFHNGDRVGHAGLEGLLHRSIARDDDGALLVTTGHDRMAFCAADAPFVVRSLEFHSSGAITLLLSDDSREPLEGGTVLIDANNRLHVAVKAHRYWALFSRSAQQGLLARLDDNGQIATDGGVVHVVMAPACDWSAVPDAPAG
jgi:hypothetical protein